MSNYDFGLSIKERLKAYDAPLREQEIQKATAEHERVLKERHRMGEGLCLFLILSSLVLVIL